MRKSLLRHYLVNGPSLAVLHLFLNWPLGIFLLLIAVVFPWFGVGMAGMTVIAAFLPALSRTVGSGSAAAAGDVAGAFVHVLVVAGFLMATGLGAVIQWFLYLYWG